MGVFARRLALVKLKMRYRSICKRMQCLKLPLMLMMIAVPGTTPLLFLLIREPWHIFWYLDNSYELHARNIQHLEYLGAAHTGEVWLEEQIQFCFCCSSLSSSTP